MRILQKVKMQKAMKGLGMDGCFGVQYEIPLFFKKTPEELEAKRQADIAELRHILEEYQERMEEEERLRAEPLPEQEKSGKKEKKKNRRS